MIGSAKTITTQKDGDHLDVYLLLLIILTLFGILSSVRKFNQFRTPFNFEMILLVLATGFWLLTADSDELAFLVSARLVELLGNIGFILLMYVYLRLSYVFTKFSFNRLVKRSSELAIVIISGLMGLRFSEILIPGSNQIFPSDMNSNILPFVSVILFLGHFLFAIVVLSSNYFFYRRMYETMYQELDTISNLTIAMIGIGIFVVLIYTYLSYYSVDAALRFLPFLRLYIGLSIIIILEYIQSNPTILMANKVNICQLINNGHIGFLLASVKDQGPTTLVSSTPFNDRYDITHAQLELFTSAKITVVGIGNSFHDSIFSIPFPQQNRLNTISISFSHADPTLKDPRMKQISSAIFSIIVPNSLIPLLSINYNMFNILMDEVSKTKSIDEFADVSKLKNLTEKLVVEII